jgi:hypothetical protein
VLLENVGAIDEEGIECDEDGDRIDDGSVVIAVAPSKCLLTVAVASGRYEQRFNIKKQHLSGSEAE